VRNSDSNAHGLAKHYAYGRADINAYSDGSGHSYAYGPGYSYTYRIAKLYTELHIHIGHRNARAGNHRHWKPLR
jgi:hypothetical protein